MAENVTLVSTRAKASHQGLRRASSGKTPRKVYIAGRRFLPKRGATMTITESEYELNRDQIEMLARKGILEVQGRTVAPEARPIAEQPANKPELESGKNVDGTDYEEPEAESGEYTRDELEAMTKGELLDLCEIAGTELGGMEKKAELVDLLLGE